MQGFKLGHKLAQQHVDQCKMKVSLATQTLSNRVAGATGFLQKCEEPGFEDAHGAITFIRHIGRLFDLLSSPSPFAKGDKQVLSGEWATVWNSLSSVGCRAAPDSHLFCHRLSSYTQTSSLAAPPIGSLIGSLAAE